MKIADSFYSLMGGAVALSRRVVGLCPSCLVVAGALVLVASFCLPVGAQTGEWTWMGGSSTLPAGGAQPGVYGTLGTPDVGNSPGTHNFQAIWTDNSGHVWLFGGSGTDSTGTDGVLNDFWKFDPSTQRWTWMGGSKTVPSCETRCGQNGVYGTLHMPAAGNIPGARIAAGSWKDSSGNFWLFGGKGVDASGPEVDRTLNDLWEFNPSTNKWAWMGGSSSANQPGSYGKMGTPAAKNFPGSRFGASHWTDNSGNFWLFGGNGVDANGATGTLNDLWTFNPATKEWTWISGSNSTPSCADTGNCGQLGVYGTLRAPAPGNAPGGHYFASGSVDSSGNLWLFGGKGYDANGKIGILNDLWKFNLSTRQWAWMGGSKTVPSCPEMGDCGQPGVYGTLGVHDAANIPGARFGAGSWTDGKGHFWLFGGEGYDAKGASGFLNDFWEFNPSTNEWTWRGGSSSPKNDGGVYGTLGVPATGNIPGGRYSSSSWTDSTGNFWLLGGVTEAGPINDLWRYEDSPTTLSLSSYNLSFAPQSIGTESASQTVTVTNNIDEAVDIAAMYVTGADTSSFVVTNDCGGYLGDGGTCTLTVSFAPKAAGALTASVTLQADPGDLTLPLNLSGTGVASGPVIQLSTTGWEFPLETVGTSSLSQPFTLTNTGTGLMLISSIAVTGADASSFVFSNNCGTSLVPGASCTIHGHFDPQAVGALTAAVTINSNAINSPQTIALSGTGGAGPVGTLSATSVAFGPVQLGSQGYQEIILTNTGSGSLSPVSVTTTGPNASEFFVNNGCAGGSFLSCGIDVYFRPTVDGPAAATVTITDAGINSPQTITLSGTGTSLSTLTLSTHSLSFGTYSVGTASPATPVTLTNTGTALVSISSVTVGGANASSFVLANNCGGSLAGTSSCNINVYFAPQTDGALTAKITIVDSDVSSPQAITLSGTGTGAVTPAVSLSATSLSFGSENVGTASGSKSVTLTNTGSVSVSITSIAVTGANASSFVFANTCGTSLAAGANCTIHGHFEPVATGALTAAIAITDNVPGSPQTIALSGTGTSGAAVTLSAHNLSFGSEPIGTAGGSQSVTLTNTGTATLSIASISVTGADASSFVFANNCGTSLAANASCSIHGHFEPAITGALTAVITIADNATGSPQTIALSGTGVGPAVSLSSSRVAFGSVKVGTQSGSESVTLTNSGSATLSITSISVTGADSSSFVFANDCGTSLATGSNCSIHGHFAPTVSGALTATITITDNESNSPQRIALSGTGTSGATVALSATSLAFGLVDVGTASASQSVTLINTGTGILSITNIAVNGADAGSYVFANSCGASLAPGAGCTIHGHFKPETEGALTATIEISDNAAGSPQSIALSGTGQ